MDILVVDDVAFMRRIIVDILVNHCGIEKKKIHESSNGMLAVREYMRLKPKMVFLDVLMPGQNGDVTVAEIVKFDPNAYIVMCTSAKEKGVVEDCTKAGAKDYILKPIDPTRLMTALKKGGFKFTADDYLEAGENKND
jgi:two-component system chemotaxis response regulator CheY